MSLSFLPLVESHFPLLLKWLEASHVKKWWDQDLVYTLDLVKEKYGDYVKGYKQINGLNKPMRAYIICLDNQPIGYIQIYNAYDFPRSKPLRELPENLGGIDVFIGEREYVGKDLGSQAIAKFLSLHANDYSQIFVDPDVNNVAAIKAYEKAGFRKILEQLDTQEVWMLWERPQALQTIQKLIKERYSQAKAIFWAGSVSSEQETKTSDLDLVIIFDYVPYAYRETFIYDGWPVDTFVHDLATLHYFYTIIDLPSLMPVLPGMVANGKLVTKDLEFGKNLQKSARELLQKKPQLDTNVFLNRRFHITDSLDDLKGAETTHGFMAVKYHLYQQLAEFYLLAHGRYIGFGKQVTRLLEELDPKIANEFFHTFSEDDVQAIEQFVEKVLEPFGGLLWDGFKLDAPKEWKAHSTTLNHSYILEELKSREPIFHHPNEFGTRKQDILDMTCDEFWEVGASGNVYTREYVIEVLLQRYSDPKYKDIWETRDFELIEVSSDNYLITYVLIQRERITRRATIWRKVGGHWKILYHQGTVIQKSKS